MDTIKSSELIESLETSDYIDRAIEYIVTSDNLKDNMPEEFADMMRYLFDARNFYKLMASKEKDGITARQILDGLCAEATPKEAADANEFVEFIDMTIEWIATSDSLLDNFPEDFDQLMYHLFKVKKFFQSFSVEVNKSKDQAEKNQLLLAAEQEAEYFTQSKIENLPLFTLKIPASKGDQMPVNFLILHNWPKDIAKTQMMSLIQQLETFDRGYYNGADLIELYSKEQLRCQHVIFIESAGAELLNKLMEEMSSTNLVILTTEITKNQLNDVIDPFDQFEKDNGVSLQTVEILSNPHRIVVSAID